MNEYKYYLGLDIGGTKCAVSVGRALGDHIDVIERLEVATTDTPEHTLGQLTDTAVGWVRQYGIERAGISSGGPLDSERGVIISPPNLEKAWHGFDIVGFVRESIGIGARLENDANASAVAEWRFGAGRGTRNMVFMTFGTGLGAGIILNGALLRGANGNAGEIGHVRLSESGPVGYGKAGSAEGFCSGGGISRLAAMMASERGIAIPDGLSTKEIFKRAEQGDGLCLDAVRVSAEKFALVISMLTDILNPEAIVVGGVFMRNYDLFMKIMTPIIEREALGESLRVLQILPSGLSENIGDVAALAIAVED
jgi:glucokinase